MKEGKKMGLKFTQEELDWLIDFTTDTCSQWEGAGLCPAINKSCIESCHIRKLYKKLKKKYDELGYK